MKISMIAAMANNRVIGKANDMPWHLPADLAYFKATTIGKPIVMGRLTYESIGFALPGRRNIVISRDPQLQIKGVEVFHDIASALAALEGVEEVMISGGGTLYAQMLPLAERLYLTHIELDVDEPEVYFPDYHQGQWQQVSNDVHQQDEINKYPYRFEVLDRVILK